MSKRAVKRVSKCLMIVLLLLTPAGVFAQTEDAGVLPLGESVSGTLTDSGDQMVYRFDVPEGQDVVVLLEADRVVMGSYCVQVESEAGTEQDCPVSGGGGGSDSPVTQRILIGGDDDPDTRKTVELTLSRPLDGAASYELQAHALTPRPLTLGEPLTLSPADGQPFQIYSIEANATLPFTAAVAEDAPGGEFLWVAFEPYKPDLFTVSEGLLPAAQYLDGIAPPDFEATQLLALYYLGGESFRVLVGAEADYVLYGAAVEIMPLGEAESTTIVLDYTEPLKVVRTASDGVGAISLDVEVTEGAGAFIQVYTLENTFAFMREVEAGASLKIDLDESAAGRFVVVQPGRNATRDPVRAEVEWTAEG